MTAGKAPRRPKAQAIAASPRSDGPGTWPVMWRVVMRGAGSYNGDRAFLETEDEAEARRRYRRWRCGGGWTVRIERVSCGPLPKAAKVSLAEMRAGNAQTPVPICAPCWAIGSGHEMRRRVRLPGCLLAGTKR